MTLKELIDNTENSKYNVQAETLEDGTTNIKLTNVNEDFEFEAKTIEDVWNYYNDFDIDDHVEMWLDAKIHGRVQGIPSVTELVDEARTIDATLEELAIELNKLQGVQ